MLLQDLPLPGLVSADCPGCRHPVRTTTEAACRAAIDDHVQYGWALWYAAAAERTCEPEDPAPAAETTP